MKKVIIIAAAVLVLLIGGGITFYVIGIGAVDASDEATVEVTIPNGSGSSEIIDILDESGLIKNKLCAKIHVKLGGYNSLQANTYTFSKSMKLSEMMTAMNEGDFNYISSSRITLIEGGTAADAADAIADKLNYSAEEILVKWSDKSYLESLKSKYWFITDAVLQDGLICPLEGYLYPETYIITDTDISIEEMTETILNHTKEELSEIKGDINKSGYDIHQFLTLSSIVENETLFESDRPIIAGVFINRLNIDMPLQSDITVLYALGEKRVNVTESETMMESPYNTYKYAGIPIGPVSSPSVATMKDVLNHDDNDYLYFFAKEDGTVIYSKTLEEHEKAVSENLWY